MTIQLTQAKRYQIAAFLPVEKMQKNIAASVSVSPSTLSPWERGLNENHNGLLRQYFPKNQPLNQVTQEDANKALAGLNH